MSKKIAVVIPFFQRKAGLLERAVSSALRQSTKSNIEIVIVDDESPVPVRNELKSLSAEELSRIIIVEQKNAGCYPASNTALDHVRDDTDYVAFLDSDDEWTEDHLEHAVWALDKGYDFYFSDFYQLNQTVSAFNRDARVDVKQHQRIHSTHPIYEYRGNMVDQIIRRNVLGTSTIVYNWKSCRDVRYLTGYNHTGAEYILWVTLAQRCRKLAFSAKPECRYGGGVNIYSESGWGTDKFLSIRHDEIKFRNYLVDNLPLSREQKLSIRKRQNRSRIGFAKGIVHSILHRRRLNASLLWKQFRLDPITYLMLFAVPEVIFYEKARHYIAGLHE